MSTTRSGRGVHLCTEAEAQRNAELRQLEEWRTNPAAAVAARKAAAPPEVRTVLDSFMSIYSNDDEMKRVSLVVAEWLVGAHSAAHDDPAKKRLARLVLGVRQFATNMVWSGVFDAPYKAGLRSKLAALGAPLGAAFVREKLQVRLGGLTLPPHTLAAADQVRCAAEGREHVLRSDIKGIVPVPEAWALGEDADPGARQHHERVYIHMLKMMAMALNKRFHKMMREVLGPYVVIDLGVMAQGKDGAWRLTPEKGVARMECKRVTDHINACGCRPALNIDVMRVIGVCKTPAQLKAALAALGARFGGCGRVKNGFTIKDASGGFELRVLMVNIVVEFGLTYAELARENLGMWEDYVEHSAPQGAAPRERWRAEAAEALAVLTGVETSALPVRFICEAQMMLHTTYCVRSHMHELYKGYRADSDAMLHEDMLAETQKVEHEELFAADGDTCLKAACRDGEIAEVERLLAAGPVSDAERNAAFVVACARGREAVASLPVLMVCAGASWGKAWKRTAAGVEAEVGAGIVSALVGGATGTEGGVDRVFGGWTALRLAANGGHELAVVQLLEVGAAVDHAWEDGATPLYSAASNGHDAVVARLLEVGATVDMAQKDGATPLFMAAQRGHDAVVARLLRAGAAVDLAEQTGMTPLFIAAQKGHDAVVARLLEMGAVLDSARKDGATPLYMASLSGHCAVVVRLLWAGAAVDRATRLGATPLHKAAEHGHDAVTVKLLDAGAAVDHAKANGATPLHTAAEYGRGMVAARLLEAGAVVDQANEAGATPLFFAAQDGHALVAEHLLGAGAVVDQARYDGFTPLIMAVQNGHTSVVARLLEAGAVVDQPAAVSGWPPLLIAAHKGHGAVVAQLLEAGANVNLADQNGMTPLFIAAYSGHDGVVERLLGAGAAADQAQKNDGDTPLHIAAQVGNYAVVVTLLAAGAKVEQVKANGATPLLTAAEYGHGAVVARLLEAGAVADHANWEGATPLFFAAQDGHDSVAVHLLGAGAVVDQMRCDGFTPLFMAAQGGHEAVVGRLLAAGAAPDLADSIGATPLFMAAQNGHEAVVARLLNAGATPDLAMSEGVHDDETDAGATPLMKATQGGHVGVASLLLAAGADADRLSVTQGSTPRSCAAVRGGAIETLFDV
jgi:ankyrin repeat protein